MAVVRKKPDASSARRPPATTPEGREAQLSAYAYDLAEQQLLDGTASSQVITQLLKAGSTRDALEKERLRRENILLASRANAIESAARVEELMKDAISAFRGYSGQPPEQGSYED